MIEFFREQFVYNTLFILRIIIFIFKAIFMFAQIFIIMLFTDFLLAFTMIALSSWFLYKVVRNIWNA
jgi:hypothetical protein